MSNFSFSSGVKWFFQSPTSPFRKRPVELPMSPSGETWKAACFLCISSNEHWWEIRWMTSSDKGLLRNLAIFLTLHDKSLGTKKIICLNYDTSLIRKNHALAYGGGRRFRAPRIAFVTQVVLLISNSHSCYLLGCDFKVSRIYNKILVFHWF